MFVGKAGTEAAQSHRTQPQKLEPPTQTKGESIEARSICGRGVICTAISRPQIHVPYRLLKYLKMLMHLFWNETRIKKENITLLQVGLLP